MARHCVFIPHRRYSIRRLSAADFFSHVKLNLTPPTTTNNTPPPTRENTSLSGNSATHTHASPPSLPCVILDVRSPQEYTEGHIPGAHSLPLFSDLERATIGTAYKMQGKEFAVHMGTQFALERVGSYLEQAGRFSGCARGTGTGLVAAGAGASVGCDSTAQYEGDDKKVEALTEGTVGDGGKIAANAIAMGRGEGADSSRRPTTQQPSSPSNTESELFIYCWRGGLRSRLFSEFLCDNGFRVAVLEGGYKAFRQHGRACLSLPLPKLVVLGGFTGSGKTAVLSELRSMGEQVIDLEHLACHRGSAFGALGQPAPPSNEHFENLLFSQWLRLDVSRRVWAEDESMRVGQCSIPQPLFSQMRNCARVMFMNVPVESRVRRLVQDYGSFSKSHLLQSILKLEKGLGGETLQKCVAALDANDLELVAALLLKYYDKTYTHGNSKRASGTVFRFDVTSDDVGDKARAVLRAVEAIS